MSMTADPQPAATTLDALDALRGQLRGDLALPGEPGYDLARPWNLAVHSAPAGVVAAADAQDICTAVRWASAHGLRVAVHATGHGSVGHGGDTLVIHTGRMTDCCIDAEQRVARIGAGVVAHQLLDTADAAGLTPLIGSAGTAGVIGFLSGGGIGPLASTFGLSSDYVRAMDVVTGDGRLYRATPDENPDLYWAMRGGKAALGIITAAELELLDVPAIYGGVLHFAASDCAPILREWARWSAQLPQIATTSLALANVPNLPGLPPALAGRFVVSVRFATAAGKDQAEALLAPIRRVTSPIVDHITTMTYRELGCAFGDPNSPVPVHQDQALLSGLPPEAVDAILRTAGPDSGSELAVVELRRLGGALARPPRRPSAFSHRDSAYSLGVVGVLAGPDSQVVATADRLLAAVGPWSRQGILANFVDTTDPPRLAQACDPATLARLRAIAATYDPAETFAAAGELPRGDESGGVTPPA